MFTPISRYQSDLVFFYPQKICHQFYDRFICRSINRFCIGIDMIDLLALLGLYDNFCLFGTWMCYYTIFHNKQKTNESGAGLRTQYDDSAGVPVGGESYSVLCDEANIPPTQSVFQPQEFLQSSKLIHIHGDDGHGHDVHAGQRLPRAHG